MKFLFVIDPIKNINPLKDSSAALMQASSKKNIEIWSCTPQDLEARGDEVWASSVKIEVNPWISFKENDCIPLAEFNCIWMRKDPPVNEAYLYATHLLEVAERKGVKVINKPSSLRAWNEKLGALRYSHLMAPTIVASKVKDLINFANINNEVVIKPLGGKGGQGVIRINKNSPGIKSIIELITSQEELPVMMQKFIPEVVEGDKRIIIVNGEAIGSINRIPQGGDFRSNLAMGGKAEPTLLTEKEKSICSELSKHFKDEGLFFVGIDVINGMLSEINVTSPTGLREIENLSNKNVSEEVIEKLVEII
ncbi:glutathione synthase [Prochlorococcus marinus XMU1419]|uniref:glutathione synthase n=1 Tax=Prochlorococcus marinus TaxID=1219 RepID=UPI001AD9A1A4|nr:glutathione synthase [Prochlorococcus marinus]MBO8233081.1 glutathione synthase [Prochlorococcus marinus XMU1419]MBW3076567.1 glutathione synthase [Prochlorococcus marinus str. XMU1419]